MEVELGGRVERLVEGYESIYIMIKSNTQKIANMRKLEKMMKMAKIRYFTNENELNVNLCEFLIFK